MVTSDEIKPNRGNSYKRVQVGYVEHIICVIIGCLPIIIRMSISAELLYKEYKLNNDNFWAQNRFFSNFKPYQLFLNLTCSNPTGPKLCAKGFNDHVISNQEAVILLK